VAGLLLPRSQHQCPNGKAELNPGRVSGNDLLSQYMFRRLFLSCIIRHAVQWLQTPLARRGDFSTVAYVVCFLTNDRGTAAHTPGGITPYHLKDA
jgi:hypothetical protein